MYNQIERELKILVSKEIYENILNSYIFDKTIYQTNTYYDTKDHLIKNNNGALRIRTIQDKNIFTLKLKKDAITHYEYEKEIKSNTISDIDDPEIKEWLMKIPLNEEVFPIASFSTIRNIHYFEHGELCVDMTQYDNHIDYEIEYEYTSEHNGIDTFNEILKPFGLKYEKNCPSKIARAFNH